MYYVYILKSLTNGKFYIGQTCDLERRLLYHNSGYSKSTKSGISWELIYIEEYDNRSDAMNRENQLKSYKNKDYIEKLIVEKASR